MELHDNISFGERAGLDMDLTEGKVTIDIEAYAANESDAKFQFIQTISEMDASELIELFESGDIQIEA